MKRLKSICQHGIYRDPEEADLACRLLAAAGIKAATNTEDLGRPGFHYAGKGVPLYIEHKDSGRADEVLELARKLWQSVTAKKKKPLLPPEEGTLVNLDMLIHDCRQYLMIATGELKSIEEEGVLALDEPTEDIRKITIRLKRLKSQCMRMAGKTGLDWEHGGGLDV